ECLADRFQEKTLILNPIRTSRLRPRLALKNGRQHTVVGSNKNVILGCCRQRASSRSNSWIDDDDMNCSDREIAIGSLDDERRLQDVVRMDIVRNIYDVHLRCNAQNHALHDSYEGVPKAEVRYERYNIWHAARLSR